jgi:hypothetical protein
MRNNKLSLIPNTFFIYKMLIFTSTSLGIITMSQKIFYFILITRWLFCGLVFNSDHFYMISLIFLLNKMIDKCDEKKYVYYHSLWHIISALKSLFIAASVTIKELQN